jgi:hypothetical protein
VERRTRCERRVRETGFPCGAARTPCRRTRLVAARHCSRCVLRAGRRRSVARARECHTFAFVPRASSVRVAWRAVAET